MSKHSEFIKKLKAMHNHIGILGDSEICRLIGFHDDESDYYYHIRYMGPSWSGHDKNKDGYYESFSSCVGPFISLKYKYLRYKYMDDMFFMNNCPREKKFLMTKSTGTF